MSVVLAVRLTAVRGRHCFVKRVGARPLSGPRDGAVSSFVCGAVSGGTQGAIGVGGGIIMTSSLVRFGGMKHAHAVGTSLPCQILGNAVSGATFAAAGLVDPLALLCVGSMAIVGARAGARLGARMDERQAKIASGALILGLAPIIAWSAWRKGEREAGRGEAAGGAGDEEEEEEEEAAAEGVDWARAWAPGALLAEAREHPLRCLQLAALGVGTGVCTGALGIGATPIMITALTLGGAHEHKACVGTALCAVVPSGAAGAATHMQLGNTQWARFPLLAAGAAIGGFAGSSIALDLPTLALQQVFAVFCAVSGVSMLRTGLFTTAARGLRRAGRSS